MTILNDTINRFITDADLAHRFTNGGPTDIVIGEGGAYPSLAKIAADSEQLLKSILQQNFPIVSKIYHFTVNDLILDASSQRLILTIDHNQDAVIFDTTIISVDGSRVYADIDIVNSNRFKVRFTAPETGSIRILFYT